MTIESDIRRGSDLMRHPVSFGAKERVETSTTSTMATANYRESAMRMATDIPQDERRTRRRIRRKKIRDRRGAFEYLPVRCSNDLVHGSWWFVVGSLLATLIPIVPLVDLFYPFWPSQATLPILSDAATFGLLIASGFFFTLGSLAFVRATEEPPLTPLFANLTIHLETDELLAAWLFLLGTIPFPIFMGVYVYYNDEVLLYWGCLFASIMFVIATYFFVLTCYPTIEFNYQLAPRISKVLFREGSWIHRHLSNDWLASVWIFYYSTLIMTLGCVWMFFDAIIRGSSLDMFDWGVSAVDAFAFLVGSAYFVAGSYPQREELAVTEQKPLLYGTDGVNSKDGITGEHIDASLLVLNDGGDDDDGAII